MWKEHTANLLCASKVLQNTRKHHVQLVSKVRLTWAPFARRFWNYCSCETLLYTL